MHPSQHSSPAGKKTTLYEGKFKRLVDENGWEFTERVNCSGVVAILAQTAEGKIILVEQYRVPVGKSVIELPAGLADGGLCLPGTVPQKGDSPLEPLEEAAKRELLEETGYQAGRMEKILEGPANSSSNADIIVLFYAHNLRKVSNGGGDHTESITVHEVDLKGIEQWFDSMRRKGKLVDPKIYAGLYWLNQKR